MENSNSPTPERLMQMAWGYAPPLVIETAIRYQLFDRLDERPQSLEELAAFTGASARGLRALLDALVGVQLLQRKDGTYQLTQESATFLVRNKPTYHGEFFRHVSDHLIPRWLTLPKAVQSGKAAKQVQEGEAGPQFFAEFVESLFPLSYPAAQVLGKHLGVPGTTRPVRVLDLGAGSGVWGIALAQQSPLVKVTTVDFPQVLEVTRKVAQRCQVDDRVDCLPGDLMTADYGRDYQVATFGHILHGAGVEGSRQLLRKAFEALAPGGTVAIQEFLTNDERTGPPLALLFAVNMLVSTETGDTFSFQEISQWLREVGFVNPRLLEVPAVSPLVLATRPC